MHKKKLKKPYKSLNEIYLKESFAKPVPLIPRQKIFFKEAKGMADVVIQKDHPEGGVQEFSVPNEVADKLISIIDRSSPQEIEGKKLSVNDIIAQCLEIDRWAPEGKGGASAVYRETVNAFENVKLNYKQFSNLLTIQKDKNNLIRNVLLKNSEPHTVSELIPESFKKLFVNPEDSLKVIQELWGILPKSDANVGPGELALTLISDAKKGVDGAPGDLDFNDLGFAELKGNNAALGSGKEAVVSTYKELDRILQSKKQGKGIQSFNIDMQKTQLIKLINDLILTYDSYVKKFKEDANGPNAIIRNKLNALLPKIQKDNNIEEIINDIKSSGLQMVTKRVNRKTGQVVESEGEQAILLRQVETLSRLSRGEITSVTGGEKSKFNPAVTAFFGSQELSIKDKIEGTKFLRSSSNTNQNLIAEVAEELLKKYPNLLTWEGRGTGGNTTSDLNRFVGAIHVAEYQQEKKFKYLILFNKDRKSKDSLPTKIVSLEFAGTGNTFKEDVIRVFEFFKNPNINASVTLGVDETRGTVRVSIK